MDIESDHVAFSILGPLTARVGGKQLSIGGPVSQRVLAMLLLEPDRVVPVDRLVDAVWDEDPPETCTHQVRKAAAALRKRIPAGHTVIVTDGPGYRLDPARCHLDLIDFDDRLRHARRLLKDGASEAAVDELRAALRLWNGTVLSGIDSSVLRAAATALDERRLTATEQVFELSIGLGECGAIIPELRALTAQHPLRETLRAQLMVALYRTGRQAEALEEYARTRELLRDSLGIDPGSRLTNLYLSVLTADDALGEPSGPTTARAPAPAPALEKETEAEPETAPSPEPAPRPEAAQPTRPVVPPRMLPAGIRDFTGRSRELARLVELIEASAEPEYRSPSVVAIDGMGGVGKTSLAIEAGHRTVERFPDGQLSIDLRGFTPGEEPLSSFKALDILLRAVGLPDDRVPDALEVRAGLWQSLLADRRYLVLLDNAASTQQLKHLLPASPGCVVVVTSRSRLTDLDGATWISVGQMDPEESVALIGEILPAERLRSEPEQVRRLADLCGHLPLALRIAAARVGSRPNWTIRYMVDRLGDESRRLAELRSNERSVEATLHLSFRAMPEAHRAAFCALGLHPGVMVDLCSAAALLGLDVMDAEEVLESLVDANLLQEPAPGIYVFHDLVRDFACGIVQTGEHTKGATGRLLDFYAAASDAACDALFPGRASRPTGLRPYGGDLPDVAGPGQAAHWFERECDALRSLVTVAVERGMDWHAVALTRNLNFYLNSNGRHDVLWELGRLAIAAARRLEEPPVLCVALSNFASACWKSGRVEDSLQGATEAHDLAIKIGDLGLEAHAGLVMGLLLTEFGRHQEALTLLTRSTALARQLSNARTEAECLTTLSTLYERQGRYRESAAAAEEAVTISRALGYRDNEMMALADLAFAQLGLGATHDAHETLVRALELCDETSSPGDVSLVEALTAMVEHQLGNAARARGLAARSLMLARASNSRVRLVRVTNLLGALHAAWQDPAGARALYLEASRLASALKFRTEERTALAGLAAVAQATETGPGERRRSSTRLTGARQG